MTTVKYDFKKNNQEEPGSMEVIPNASPFGSKLHQTLGLTIERMIELQDLIYNAPKVRTIAEVMQHCSKGCKNPNELAFIVYCIATENIMANVDAGKEFRHPIVATPKDEIS